MGGFVGFFKDPAHGLDLIGENPTETSLKKSKSEVSRPRRFGRIQAPWRAAITCIRRRIFNQLGIVLTAEISNMSGQNSDTVLYDSTSYQSCAVRHEVVKSFSSALRALIFPQILFSRPPGDGETDPFEKIFLHIWS